MKNIFAIFLLLSSVLSEAQIIDEVYFLNEDNRIIFFDSKTSFFDKIIKVEVEAAELFKSSIKIKHENDEWFINPKHAGTAYLKLIGEHRKKKTLKVLFMELPSMIFYFEGDRNLKTIEDYHFREKEKPFLDSLNKWEELNPGFELKSIFRIYPKNLPKEIFTMIDSAFVELKYEDRTVFQKLKFKGSELPRSLMHEIIKYAPENLKINFSEVYLTINNQIRKQFKDITFDFKK